MSKPNKTKNQKQIEKLESQLVEYESKYKRALADYQNLEKRSAQQRLDFAKMATASLIESILTVVDDLDRAAHHSEDQGLQMINQQLLQVVKDEGVEEIEVLDQEFNPEVMECIEVVEGPKNQIVSVTQAGYTLGKRVLRPAKVQVGGGQTKKENTK